MTIAYTRHREKSLVAELRRSRKVIAEQRAEIERVMLHAAMTVEIMGEENERLRRLLAGRGEADGLMVEREGCRE
jgi:hypothetical protein